MTIVFRKSCVLACSTLILVTLLISISGLGSNLKITVANGEGLTAHVGLTPLSIVVRQHENFTVSLSISSVENLYAYEIMVWYNNSVISATTVVRPLGHFLQPMNPDNCFEVRWQIRNDYNATHGRIWLAYTLLSPESPRSGDGLLATISFQGLAVGVTSVALNDCPGKQGPVKLADGIVGNPITHTADEGSVIVISTVTGDVNGDGRVDTLDLAAVAIAFGSRPDNPRWNPEADLDRNNAVNILDLLCVIFNCGKTS